MPPRVANPTATLRSRWPQVWEAVPQARHVKPYEIFRKVLCVDASHPISSHYSTRAFILHFPPPGFHTSCSFLQLPWGCD